MTISEPLTAEERFHLGAAAVRALGSLPDDTEPEVAYGVLAVALMGEVQKIRDRAMARAWDEGRRFTGYEPSLGENPYPREDSKALTPAYEQVAERATRDPAYRDGLLAAAAVCRAQGADPALPSCPSGMAAIYIDILANGDLP